MTEQSPVRRSCVFLVETSQCIAVLLVNYKGRPWMKGLTENHALFLSVSRTSSLMHLAPR